ncbi:MAG: TetR/AcrR family transcriptional regulator [Candidatus Hydrogenedentes bacterium]|nr:TetR/AcrR family transcriptional regulator [Candidatus Hydrogenedentota bacterium]
MARQTRKQRDWQRRERLILAAADRLLVELGYHGLTMDRIAEAVEYSKGTVYQHFHCKEEVITTLACHYLRIHLAMHERAAQLKGRSRERITAVGEAYELFTRLYLPENRVLQIIRSEVVTEKASQECQFAMKTIEFRGIEIVTDIIRDAITQEDLVLPKGTYPEGLAFGLWAVVSGAHANILRALPFHEIHIPDPFAATWKTSEVLCDGYNWRPLSSECDYEEVRERVRQQLFPEEAKRVKNPDARLWPAPGWQDPTDLRPLRGVDDLLSSRN